MTSEEFWKSPIPPERTKVYEVGEKRKGEPLPDPIEVKKVEIDGRIFEVKVLPGFNGKAAPLPEKLTKVGDFAITDDGRIQPLRGAI